MSLKIVKTGNSIVVTDTVAVKDIIDVPAKLVYYDLDELVNNENIRLLHISTSDSLHQRFPTIALADAINSADEAFTVDSFKTFARTNLG